MVLSHNEIVMLTTIMAAHYDDLSTLNYKDILTPLCDKRQATRLEGFLGSLCDIFEYKAGIEFDIKDEYMPRVQSGHICVDVDHSAFQDAVYSIAEYKNPKRSGDLLRAVEAYNAAVDIKKIDMAMITRVLDVINANPESSTPTIPPKNDSTVVRLADFRRKL